jgi:hypothetical protein
MARDYILRESATQRKALVGAVVASMTRFDVDTSPGVGLSLRMGHDPNDYRVQLLEKLYTGIPLADIPEFEKWMNEAAAESEEIERKRRNWREIGLYRTSITNLADQIFGKEVAPTESQFSQLIEAISKCPLLHGLSPTLDDVRSVCSRHPWLNLTISLLVGHLRFIELAAEEQRPYFIDRMWRAWATQNPRYATQEVSRKDFDFPDFEAFSLHHSKPEPFHYDEPPIIFFENMQFAFSGKFRFGTRKQCGEAVTKLGGEAVASPNRWVDYLVIASGGENTSPQSSTCSPILNWRERGWPCFVISEETWTNFLPTHQ